MAVRGAGLRGCARARGGAAPSPREPGGSRLPPAAPPAAHLRSPLSGSSRRTVSTHGRESAAPRASRPSASFVDFSFRLCGCCFLFYQTTPQPHRHRCLPPASLPLLGSALKPREPARGSLSRLDRCFLWPSAVPSRALSSLALEMLFRS